MYVNYALQRIIPCKRLATQLGRTLPVSSGTAVPQLSQHSLQSTGLCCKRDKYKMVPFVKSCKPGIFTYKVKNAVSHNQTFVSIGWLLYIIFKFLDFSSDRMSQYVSDCCPLCNGTFYTTK
jgi:hypothetical protein